MLAGPERLLYGPEHLADYVKIDIETLLCYPGTWHLRTVQVVAPPQSTEAVDDRIFVSHLRTAKGNLCVRGTTQNNTVALMSLHNCGDMGIPVTFKGLYVACPINPGDQAAFTEVRRAEYVAFLNKTFAPGELRIAAMRCGIKEYADFHVTREPVLFHTDAYLRSLQ